MRRDVVATNDAQALGQKIAELEKRVNELSALAGLPPLRVAAVVSIPEDPFADDELVEDGA